MRESLKQERKKKKKEIFEGNMKGLQGNNEDESNEKTQ